MTELKEPHHFGRDLIRVNRPPPNRDRYLSRFEGAAGFPVRGEASTSYLQSSSAPHEIKELSPEARIIILLRNPVDVMYALHGEQLLSGFEQLHDFGEALQAEARRRRGEDRPNRAGVLNLLFYREVVDYPRHVARYFDVFGRSSVLVLFFEEFFADPAARFPDVLDFLEVEEDRSPDFEIVNPSKRVRFKWLQDLIASPPSYIAKIGDVLIPNRLHGKTSHALLRWNTRVQKRPPLPSQLRRTLRQEQSDRIDRLGNLLDTEPPW